MELLALLPLALLAWAVARSVRARRIQKQQDERLQRLERRIDALAMTLSEVMPRTGPRSETAPPPTSPVGESPQSRPSPESPQPQRPKAEPRQAEHPSVPVTPRSTSASPPGPMPAAPPHGPGLGLELQLTSRWLVWLGAITIALGSVFLVRYSIERGLAELTGLYRAASFLGLGLCLVGIGYLYQRLVLPSPGPGEAGQKS